MCIFAVEYTPMGNKRFLLHIFITKIQPEGTPMAFAVK